MRSISGSTVDDNRPPESNLGRRLDTRRLLIIAALLCAAFYFLSSLLPANPSSYYDRTLYTDVSSSPDDQSSSSFFSHRPDPLSIRWDLHSSLPDRNFHIVSASQDHRAFPPPARLPADPAVRAATFPELAGDPRLRIFQLHLGLANRFVTVLKDNSWTSAFGTVELWWHDQPDDDVDGAADIGSTAEQVVLIEGVGRMVVKRLPAQQCLHDLPKGTDYRMANGQPAYLELVVRCAFLVDDVVVARLRDHARARGALKVHAAGDAALFPLAEVLHFPDPTTFLTYDEYDERPAAFAAAPWEPVSVVRAPAGSAAAAIRVGAVCTKKYSWNADDELWLMWMLDIVGVDHIVIAVSTRDLNMSTVVDAIARYDDPRLTARVTLVDLDVPTGQPKVTYSYLLECMGREAFLRWQADFDFLFLIDPDEFVQLFAAEPPHARIDVKTFVARHRDRIEREGVAYLRRPRVRRLESDHRAAEPLLPALLRALAPLDGAAMHHLLGPDASYAREFGKSLFWPPRAIHSFLHFNPDSLPDWFDARQAHMLHVRKDNPYGGQPVRTVQEYLDQIKNKIK